MIIPYASWLVWIIPLACSLLLPLFAKISDAFRNAFAIVVSVITAFLAFSMIPDILNASGSTSDVGWIPILNIDAGVIVDALSILFACLISFFGVIIVIYSLGYMKDEEGLTRYYFLLLLFIGSMIGLVMADNFLQMFIFWEMVGLCSYALISFWYKKPESVKAGIKVFLMTRIGDIFFLAAIAMLYIYIGSFSFTTITTVILAQVKNNSLNIPYITIISFFIFIGAMAKSAQLPLHTWLYAAMEAPTSISALLHAATMVKAGVYLIARFILIIGIVSLLIPNWLATIVWVGVLTALVAGTLALSSPDVKGVQAYSTVSQLGFMIAALGTAVTSLSAGWFASLYQMVGHAFFQGLNFLLIGGIIHAVDTRDMRQMGGLRKRMPVTFILSIIYLITAIGLPPLPTFFSKELIISSIWASSSVFGSQSIVLGILIYIATGLTFAYALRYILMVFGGEESPYIKNVHVHESPKIMLIVASILAGLCLIFEFFGPLLGTFMQVSTTVDADVGLGVFSSDYLGIIVFVIALFCGGFPIYMLYAKKNPTMQKLHDSRGFQKFNHILEKGYYLDPLYDQVIPKGINLISTNLYHYVESSALHEMAGGISKFIQTLGAKIRQWDTGSLQAAIISFIFGIIFIFIIVLIITV